MNQHLQIIRILYLLIFICPNSVTFGQGTNTYPKIQSCYQEMAFDANNQIKNLLRSNTLKFNYSGNAGADPDYWSIKQYDAYGIEIPTSYNVLGLADVNFGSRFLYSEDNVRYHVVRAAKTNSNGVYVYNTNEFGFDANAKTVTIVPGFYKEFPNGSGNYIFQTGDNWLHLEIKDPDEVFTINPPEGTCNTFDNFNLSLLYDLNGFCGNIKGLLKLPPPPQPLGWPLGYEEIISFKAANILNPPQDYCFNTCFDAMAEWDYPDPVPCGCWDFEVEITIELCVNAPAECENLIFTKKVKICCECDIRPPAPGF